MSSGDNQNNNNNNNSSISNNNNHNNFLLHNNINNGFRALADRVENRGDPAATAAILGELGPACTRSTVVFRDVLADVLFATTGAARHNEGTLAQIIYFFSDKTESTSDANPNNNAGGVVGLSSALLGSIVPGRFGVGNHPDPNSINNNAWNLDVVAQVLAEDFGPTADWVAVANRFDTPNFQIQNTTQFRTLLDLYRAGAQCTPPLTAFTNPSWRNLNGQLSVLEAILTVPPAVFMVPLDEDELADAATAPPSDSGAQQMPNPQCWASMEILQRLLQLSDVPSLYRRVRDLFVRCLLTCPEVLLCSLVRLQLKVANAAASGDTNNNLLVSAGLQLKTELMRELIPLFFRPNAHPHRVRNGPAALRRLYVISPTTVMAACFEAWRSSAIVTNNPTPADGSVASNSSSAQLRLGSIVHIINIARFLPSPAEAVASLLSGSRDAEYSISIAFVMADNEYLQLKPWLGEKLTSKASVTNFAVALVSYLRKTYNIALPRSNSGSMVETANNSNVTPLVSLENMAISLELLQALEPSVLLQPVAMDRANAAGPTLGDNVRAVVDLCLSTHPSLRGAIKNVTPLPPAAVPAPAPSSSSSATSDDVEEMATAYFQKIYTSEQSIGEVVEMLKRFKTSGNSKENEIFACMVHNLFDEYRFFAKYPEKELRITGILFGALIQEQLVSSITLGVALRYVLEALRKPPSPPGQTTSSGKMFKFGMFALEQFKSRLHEWPQYCSHIVRIPHLREGYAELVAEIEQEMSNSNQNRAITAAESPSTTPSLSQQQPSVPGSSVGVGDASLSTAQLDPVISSVPPKPRVAEFGPNLGRAVTDELDEEFEAPPDATLDRVQFLVNNLAPSNVEQKAAELKEMLDPKYFGWLAHFLVVKRISTQANFHSLYLSFLDNLGDYGKGLVEAILKSVYHNIGKLLRSQKITTSSSERSYLKNLGIWLGQITLARNLPIKQIMLDCRELLLQGYETGKLIAVAPFLAKTLEGAKNSIVFRPPNPWLMGLLGVFRSVYNVEGLKMNIKFEVEVLCKNLGIKLEDIPLRNEILLQRIAPVKERNPDFNIKTVTTQKTVPITRAVVGSPEIQAQGMSIQGTDSGRTTPSASEQEETVIPNLASYVTVNPTLPQILQSQGGGVLSNLNLTSLKRWVPIAVDRAIREIIQPVVERSVTIACITAKEIVTKDFAMESDETKMRKAGQLMVANLAGSLALVTCREPLRSSISTHLRQLLTNNIGRAESVGEQEQNVIEQCVQICATDNLELGCRLIEKAATEKAVRDVDDALATAMNQRRKHREQTGEPFFDMSIFSNGGQRYPAALPDELRPKPGGLQTEHFQLYESFQRLPRQSHTQAPMPATTSGIGPGRGLTPSGSVAEESIVGSGIKQGPNQQFGMDILRSIAAKLDSSITSLLSAAGTRAREVKLAMLPPDHQICQLLAAIRQVMPNSGPAGTVTGALSTSEQELILGFSQGIFKKLYELSLAEPLRLEAFVTVLENINTYCPKLGRDLGTWATYAPTNTEPQRRLHRTVLLLLIRSRLLAVHELDSFLAARADQGRNHVWVEFSLVFIRTAFMERISIPADFPKLIELMTRIAEGRSQATSQVAQAVRKPILQMLEETRGTGVIRELPAQQTQPQLQQQPMAPPSGTRSISAVSGASLLASSCLSTTSMLRLLQAPKLIAEATDRFAKMDPPNARQQITALLETWIRLQSESLLGDKTLAQYLQVLQQWGVGKSEAHTERFFRVGSLVIVEAVLKSSTPVASSKTSLNHTFIDMYCKLLVLLFRHMNSGGSQDQIDTQRLSVLNKILGSIVRSMMWHYEKSGRTGWDQRPWFRMLLNLVIDLNKPDPALEGIRLGVLSVFGAAFHVCQPLVMPAFAFAWLELVSHRHFFPNLLLVSGQKGWNIAHQLLVDHLLFLEPYLRRIELTQPIKKLCEGTLRVLLVILHDYPLFLASYHLSLCNIIPENCVQLRNIILSASPKGIAAPDPFTPNLKIDLLPETSQNPVILSDVLAPMANLKNHLDVYLKGTGNRPTFLSGLFQLLYRDGTTRIDAPKVNSLVLYVGAHALARSQNAQISLSRTPDIELFQRLMELDDRGRYICLNAMANQLRFPSSHTHYFSCVILYIFSESKSVAVKEQITRVLLERLIVNRPHPWGILVTFIELIKNQRYGFWNYSFTRCASEIEKIFESVARSCMPPGVQRSALVGGEE